MAIWPMLMRICIFVMVVSHSLCNWARSQEVPTSWCIKMPMVFDVILSKVTVYLSFCYHNIMTNYILGFISKAQCHVKHVHD